MVPTILTEIVETGDKNRGMTSDMHMFCEEIKRDFPERDSPRTLSLESFDYFGTTEYFSGRKKEESS